MRKRLLSVFLTICMILTLAPAAFAAESDPFSDVNASDWYYDHVQYVYENGLMVGIGDGKFAPDMTTTRGMIVSILYRLEGSPAVASRLFTDVEAGMYYANAIAWAAENGIAYGYGDGRFGPDDTITREQLAAIMYRYAQYKGYDVTAAADLSGFADASDISDYAVPAMQWANGVGLIVGTSKTTISPKGNATRAQVAAILHRFCATDVATVDGVKVVDGTDGYTEVTAPVVGQKLTANIVTNKGVIGSYPVNADASYKWFYEGSDAVLGTEAVFTVTEDNMGKTLCVEVSVKGYNGVAAWTAKKAVAVGTVTGVKVVDGTDGYTEVAAPVVGQKLTANIVTNNGEIGSYPVNTDASYKWFYEGSDAVLGTEAVFTVTEDNVGKTLCVEVSVKGYNGVAAWTAKKAVAVGTVTGVKVVDGTDGYTEVAAPEVGQKLTANIQTTKGEIGSYPVNADASYKWFYEGSDAVLGTEAVFTVTVDNVGKTLCVEVSVKDYNDVATWTAKKAVVAGTVTGVKVVDGTDGYTEVTAPVVGQKLTANIVTNQGEIGSYPVNADASYKWSYKDSDTVLGTDPVYTVTVDNVGKTLCVQVSVKNYAGEATWTASEVVPAFMEAQDFAYGVEPDGTEFYNVGFKILGVNDETADAVYASIKKIEVKLFADGKEIANSVTVEGEGKGIDLLKADDNAYGGYDGQLSVAFIQLDEELAGSYWVRSPYDFTEPDRAEIIITVADGEAEIVYKVENSNLYPTK